MENMAGRIVKQQGVLANKKYLFNIKKFVAMYYRQKNSGGMLGWKFGGPT